MYDLPGHGEAKVAFHFFDRRANPSSRRGFLIFLPAPKMCRPQTQRAADDFIRGPFATQRFIEAYWYSAAPPAAPLAVPLAKILPSGIVIEALPIRLLSGFFARTPLT